MGQRNDEGWDMAWWIYRKMLGGAGSELRVGGGATMQGSPTVVNGINEVGNALKAIRCCPPVVFFDDAGMARMLPKNCELAYLSCVVETCDGHDA